MESTHAAGRAEQVEEADVLPHAARNTLRHFAFSHCEPIYQALGMGREGAGAGAGAGTRAGVRKLPMLLAWGEKDSAVSFKGAAVIQGTSTPAHLCHSADEPSSLPPYYY